MSYNMHGVNLEGHKIQMRCNLLTSPLLYIVLLMLMQQSIVCAQTNSTVSNSSRQHSSKKNQEAEAEQKPPIAALKAPKYVGAASCASSNCHGAIAPRQGARIGHNEYVLWEKRDYHSQAWLSLTSQDAKKMAAHLGIKAPEAEPLCLACHATVADINQQGPEFKLDDGVSCESCHGAAEGYLVSHAARNATHAENLKAGLKDIVSLQARADLCLRCHYGSEEAQVDHRLIGAGHPRLSFELDTFGILQPRHWVVDDDYVARKGGYDHAQAWIIGQIQLAKKMLGEFKRSSGSLPNFTVMNCYSCHHSLQEQQWKKREYQGRPGELRLNVAPFMVIEHALRVVKPELAQEFNALVEELHKNLLFLKLDRVLIKLDHILEELPSEFTQKSFNLDQLRSIALTILKAARQQPNLHYEYAEQSAMAISSIVAALKSNRFESELGGLYDALQDPSQFNAERFTHACHQFEVKLSRS